MENNRAATGQISITEITSDSPAALIADARELLLEYGRFVIAQPGSARFCFGSLEKEAADLPASYQSNGGGCLIAYLDGKAVGFVAWRDLPSSAATGAWEMKRLWVRSEARGSGLGRTLTTAVIERARAAKRTAIYLDTVPESMASAYRLYLDLGFKPCPPYNDNTMDGITFLSLTL
jgi:putative acetyltransferase